MDVRLPNGVVIKNVPEGTSKKQLMDMAVKKGLIEPDASMQDKALGAAEVAETVVSSAIAEPIAGLAGIAGTLLPGEEGQGAEWVEATRQALTQMPRTEEGRKQLTALARGLQPIANVLEAAETAGGELGYDVAGPVGGAIGETIPTAILEALPVPAQMARTKRAAGAENRAVRQAISEAAPDRDMLREASRARFQAIDESGARIDADDFLDLAARAERTANRMGVDPDVTPRSHGVLNRFMRELDRPTHQISDLETLRKVSNRAAQTTERGDQAIALAIRDEIDNFIDTLDPSQIQGAENAGRTLREARNLWGRSRKSELIQDVLNEAPQQASGTENGIRIGLRKLLRNKKTRNLFSAQERAEMQRVIEGTNLANTAKFLGRFGLFEGPSTGALGMAAGSAGGGALGSLFGPVGAGVGAVSVPAVGQVSRGLAQRLTRNNARFADAVVRAGNNADDIARAYIRNTPESARDARELAELFINQEIPPATLEAMTNRRNPIFSDAAFLAINTMRQPTEEEIQSEVIEE